MNLRIFPVAVIVAVCLISVSAFANQTSRIQPGKVITGNFSGDGDITINASSFVTNFTTGEGYCYSYYSVSTQGCLINATLTAWRNWTLPDESGTVALANNKGSLPATVAYEDEANVFALVQSFSDGIFVTIGECIAFNADTFLCRNGANSLNTTGAFTADTSFVVRHEQINGTFIAKTNSYLEGPVLGNNSLDVTSDISSQFGTSKKVTIGDVGPASESAVCLGNGGTCLYRDAGTDVLRVDDFARFDSGFDAEGGVISGIARNSINLDFGQAEFVSDTVGRPAATFRNTGGSSLAFAVLDASGSGYATASVFKVFSSGNVEIDGDLDHDGTNAGLYGKLTAQAADIVQITDSTSGTASNTCAAIPNPADSPITADALRDDIVANVLPAIRNCYATIIAKLNAMDTAIDNIGITA